MYSFNVAFGIISLGAILNAAAMEVITHCTKPNTIALTFDDGPYIYLRDAVDMLDKAGAKATFFMNGFNYDCIYEALATDVVYAYDQGHQIASHTWRHANLTHPGYSKAQIRSEFARVEDAITKITGACPAFTRPPWGNYNKVVEEVAAERHQDLVIWDFDTRDANNATPQEINAAYSNIGEKHPKNLLTLQHETHKTTVYEVLPHALRVFGEKGYKLVTVAECVGKAPYLFVGKPRAKDSTWTCKD